MDKADFPWKQPDQVEVEKLKQELKEDSSVKVLLERGDIDASCIDRFPYQIHKWRQDFAPCIGCKSLSACSQKKKGYFMSLKYDGILQRVETACRYEREKLKQQKHLERYLLNDMPEHLYSVMLGNIDLSHESSAYVTVFAKAAQASLMNRSVYLYGTMGSGKTYLCAGACNEHACRGEKTAFIHYPTFTSKMASMAYSGEFRSAVEKLSYAKFVVIDDIGAESVTEWNRDNILLPVLNARYEAKLPTWFTSNYDPAALKSHFSFTSKGNEDLLKAARIVERIEVGCELLALSCEDRRKSV